MRVRFTWVLGLLLLAEVARAQSTVAPPPSLALPPSLAPAQPEQPPTIEGEAVLVEPESNRFWVRGEFIGWWVKNAPLTLSLLTGDPNNPTQELLNAPRSFTMAPGLRIGVGLWLDENFGVDTTFLYLNRRENTFSAASDAAGNPVLAFPYINQTDGASGSSLWYIAMPGTFAGDVRVTSTLDLWGNETNVTLSVLRLDQWQVTGILGFRYLDLKENLTISTLSNGITTTPNTVLMQNDIFGTRNHFYGAQIGGRVTWQGARFGLDVAGKLAVGGTYQVLDIQGSSTQTGPTGTVTGTFPGGFFTQPSNLGRTASNQFSVVPTLEVKLHVLLTPRLRAYAGYDFVYWSNVIRPGNQIDNNINYGQTGTIFNSGPNGPAYPVVPWTRSDFWAQGFNVGLEFLF